MIIVALSASGLSGMGYPKEELDSKATVTLASTLWWPEVTPPCAQYVVAGARNKYNPCPMPIFALAFSGLLRMANLKTACLKAEAPSGQNDGFVESYTKMTVAQVRCCSRAPVPWQTLLRHCGVTWCQLMLLTGWRGTHSHRAAVSAMMKGSNVMQI